jgi:hypothetical protein
VVLGADCPRYKGRLAHSGDGPLEPAITDDHHVTVAIEHNHGVGEHEVFDPVAEVAQDGDAGRGRAGVVEVAAAAVVTPYRLDRAGQQCFGGNLASADLDALLGELANERVIETITSKPARGKPTTTYRWTGPPTSARSGLADLLGGRTYEVMNVRA